MNQTIYISDLDGTLLNSKKEVSKISATLLNEAIEEGVHFSIATARTPATVENILCNVKVKEPIIVMNGVALYDLSKHEYIDVEYLQASIAKAVIECLGETIAHGLIYTIHENRLTVYYDQLIGKGRINFYEERKNLKYKCFIKDKVKDLNNIIYFVFIDVKERIQEIYDMLLSISGLDMVMYKDIYDEEAYILEVYSDKATKSKGIAKLKELRGFEQTICFGDQLNDLSMFQLADEAYAVENAVDAVKTIATAVIGSHEKDSVAQFIKSHYEQSIKNKCKK